MAPQFPGLPLVLLLNILHVNFFLRATNVCKRVCAAVNLGSLMPQTLHSMPRSGGTRWSHDGLERMGLAAKVAFALVLDRRNPSG